MPLCPTQNAYASKAMAVSSDGLATATALDILRRGGSAVDAAIAANAVLTVTLPNQCGLGGDLFALVHQPGSQPRLLAAVGRAGSGSDAVVLRGEGHDAVPKHDIRSVTIPGCVDGWTALHRAYGRLALSDLLAPAIDYANAGFPASAFLVEAISGRDDFTAHIYGADDGVRPGQRLRRPPVAKILEEVAKGGREAFYRGTFGRALEDVGNGVFTRADLKVVQAEWREPLVADVLGVKVWTTPPPTSGYVTLAAAWVADRLDVPEDPSDGAWPHLLIEAMRHVAVDRPDVLFDGADGRKLIAPARLSSGVTAIQSDQAADLHDTYREGGTTYLAVVDEDQMSISLIQSNCMSFGSRIVAPGTGIWLQNRGTGFSLVEGHPNELKPGRRPAHTLSPAIVTDDTSRMRACLGTRGGDSQPQVVLQLLHRLLRHRESPAAALAAPRWILRGDRDDTAFNTWGYGGKVRVCVEENASHAWKSNLQRTGHRVTCEPAFGHPFGHAHVIARFGDALVGGADPRSGSSVALGY